MSKAKDFVYDDLDKPSNVGEFGVRYTQSVQKEVGNGGEGGTAKRGSEQRDFEKFLWKHDEDQLYAGLRRVCGEKVGTAIWVSEASTKKIEMGGSEEMVKLEEEVKRLKEGGGGGGEEEDKSRSENVELLSEIDKLKAQLAAAQTRAPAKLREEVKEAQIGKVASIMAPAVVDDDFRQVTDSKLNRLLDKQEVTGAKVDATHAKVDGKNFDSILELQKKNKKIDALMKMVTELSTRSKGGSPRKKTFSSDANRNDDAGWGGA